MTQDRAVAEDESKAKTVEQGLAVHQATVWRRKALRLGGLLKRRGIAQASDLAKITSVDKSLPNLVKELQEKIGLVKEYAPKTPNPAWAARLISSGEPF